MLEGFNIQNFNALGMWRDKKRGLVLLDSDGPKWDVGLPAEDVRRALDELISDD